MCTRVQTVMCNSRYLCVLLADFAALHFNVARIALDIESGATWPSSSKARKVTNPTTLIQPICSYHWLLSSACLRIAI
jgi:hypothetical protein